MDLIFIINIYYTYKFYSLLLLLYCRKKTTVCSYVLVFVWRDEKVSDSTVIVVGVTVLNKVIYIYIDAFMAFFLLSCKMNIRDRVCSFRQTFFFQVNVSGILVIAFPSKVCVRFRLKGKEFEARLGVWVKFTNNNTEEFGLPVPVIVLCIYF